RQWSASARLHAGRTRKIQPNLLPEVLARSFAETATTLMPEARFPARAARPFVAEISVPRLVLRRGRRGQPPDTLEPPRAVEDTDSPCSTMDDLVPLRWVPPMQQDLLAAS